ncbi:MAG: Holliday junction resolvase RuvX [Candidatus Saccharimonadales bacterium]
MQKPTNYLGLDVGTKRIGMAQADDLIKIARPLPTIMADEDCFEVIARCANNENCQTIVVGYPRNLSGEPTAQTASVEAFVSTLRQHFDGNIVYQDESLTSVTAEQRLGADTHRIKRGDIDAEAACIIVTDYLESQHGR